MDPVQDLTKYAFTDPARNILYSLQHDLDDLVEDGVKYFSMLSCNFLPFSSSWQKYLCYSTAYLLGNELGDRAGDSVSNLLGAREISQTSEGDMMARCDDVEPSASAKASTVQTFGGLTAILKNLCSDLTEDALKLSVYYAFHEGVAQTITNTVNARMQSRILGLPLRSNAKSILVNGVYFWTVFYRLGTTLGVYSYWNNYGDSLGDQSKALEIKNIFVSAAVISVGSLLWQQPSTNP